MIRITFFEDMFLVNFNNEYNHNDFSYYINTIMFKFKGCAIPNTYTCGGWFFKYDEYDNVINAFKDIIFENEELKPEFLSIGQNMILKPYVYQKQAIYFSLTNKESLLVLPCGAGKTPIIIGTYLEAINNNIIDTQGLIIVKSSLKSQWQKEVSKFSKLKANILSTYSDVNSYYIQKIKLLNRSLSKIKDKEKINEINNKIKEYKLKAKDNFISQFNDCDILIANYETLLDELVLKELLNKKIDFIGADEIHYVKSKDAKRSKALYNFNKAKIKIGATATPITKDPRDIYGIFQFINPDILGKYNEFSRFYIKFAGYGRINGFKNIDNLKGKIKNNIFLKTKEEIAKQLPSLAVFEKTCDLTTEQYDMFNRIIEEIDELNKKDFEIRSKCKSENEALLNEELQKISTKIMALQTFAQEITNSPLLLSNSDSEMAKQYSIKNQENPKLDLCIELVDEIIQSGEKVIIFSKFERMQSILANAIKKINKNIEVAYVNGSLSSSERFTQVYEIFKNNDNCKVLLCSDAGAEGLNCGFCKYMIEYEPAMSYAIQTQRHGRLERADSIFDNVIVYQLSANNSWDSIANKIIDKKENFDINIIKSLL